MRIFNRESSVAPYRCALFSLLALICVMQPLAAQEPQDEMPVLTAASNMLHPPFSSWDSEGDGKQAVGIEVDIVNAAAAELGLEVRWIERPFAELIDAVAAGEIDIAVATIGVTEARQQRVAFSDPYFETQIVALVKPDSPYQTLDQLADQKIGADQATTSFTAAEEQWPNASLIGAADVETTWLQLVERGEIDAFVVDASDQDRLQSRDGIELRRIEQPLRSEWFAVAMQKERSDLADAMNRAIADQRKSIPLRIGGEFQYTTPLGKPFASLSNPPRQLVENYLAAKENLEQYPDDVEAIIWFGRRAGYLLRLNEAIQIYSDGIQKHPDDARLYRHRGHRYISTRQFDKAIADFEKAVELIAGTDDTSEPDGAPNARGIQLTTLHGNIWYHLGLAYYLKNDMENALRCFGRRVGNHQYDDNVVSTDHWTYMILRRQGKTEEAADLVRDIHTEMNIIENQRYFEMCLFYAGKIDESELEQTIELEEDVDVIRYGLGNWQLYDRGSDNQGDEDRDNESAARELFEALLEEGSPASFAFIAAESDYVRLFGHREGAQK